MLITGDSCCDQIEWQIALSQPGWVNCPRGRYLNALRFNSIGYSGVIDHTKKGRCCAPPQEYQDVTVVCQTVDWKSSLSRSVQGVKLLQ